MARTLPRLRMDLDFMPSPVPDRPGLLIRDPHQYSDVTLIIPPPLVKLLQRFDGESTELDLRADLVRMTGSIEVSEIENHLFATLSNAGFLEDGAYDRLREDRRRRFAEAPVREPAHSGSAYPDEAGALREKFGEYLVAGVDGLVANGLAGIAAPHVSPEGGSKMYSLAYRALPPQARNRVFVILGTSHYGPPGRFGLTRKPFLTPYGEARTETDLVDRLAALAPDSIEMEDYCHSVEHSIEFQVVFLQHVFGPDIRILPILCGSFAQSILDDRLPEDDYAVKHFFDALGGIAAAAGDRLFWVLGVDMAHMGRRYGDSFPARAGEGMMREVETRDRERIRSIEAGDPAAFWKLVRQRRDDLKWCGSSAFYTLMKARPDLRGSTLGYEQWNIDDQSVVSFGAMGFHAR